MISLLYISLFVCNFVLGVLIIIRKVSIHRMIFDIYNSRNSRENNISSFKFHRSSKSLVDEFSSTEITLWSF